MARGRPGPKPKKAGPKSKKVEEKEPEVIESEEEEVKEEEEDLKEKNNGSAKDVESEEEEPSAKKGKGRPKKPAKKTPAKKAGRSTSRGRKNPAKKIEESESEDETECEMERERTGPKSKKAGPKSKKLEEKEPEMIESEDEEAPPTKKGKGLPKTPGKKTTPTKKAGRSTSRGPKTPAKKVEQSESEEEAEYEVHSILEERNRKGAMEYKVRWKGYSANSATWEPVKNLSCADAIDDFKKKKEENREVHSTAAKKAGRSTSRARKTPAKKVEKMESEEEDETEYEVHSILEERNRKGVMEYKVRWKGYSAKSATWEPVKNLSCADAIDDFKKKKEEPKNAHTKSLLEAPKKAERYADVAGHGGEHRMRRSKRCAGPVGKSASEN